MVRPGTDGAVACAIMHVLFRDGLADRDYLARYTEGAAELEAHLASRSPQWAETISGVPAAQIEALAGRYGRTDRSYIRLGYGFARPRNGPAQVPAAASIAAAGGQWPHRGGRALAEVDGFYPVDKKLNRAHHRPPPRHRVLATSRNP